MGKRNKTLVYLLTYTCLFSVIYFLGYSSFAGKSFVWNHDGKTQHLPGLIYTGEYLRTIAGHILAGSFVWPLFDFRPGLGDGILGPLTANVHSVPISPLTLGSLLVPYRYMERYYDLIVVLRLYFSGLTFSYFCREVLKAKPWATLNGAVIYAFSGWALFTAVRHPAFMLALVYTPLLATGLDRILNNKKPWLFILAMFLSAVSGFYFLFMETIFLFFYAAVRIHHLQRGRKYLRALLTQGLKVALYYIIGLLTASFAFIPLVVAQLGSGRLGHVNTYSLWHYSFEEYGGFFLKSIAGPASWSALDLAALALIAAVLLLLVKIEPKKHLLAGLMILLAFYLIPFGGYVFNGFGYVSPRWTFLLVFTLAFITAYALPHIIDLNFKGRLALLFLLFLYGGLTIFCDQARSLHTLAGLGFLAITAFCLAVNFEDQPKLMRMNHLLTGRGLKIALITLVTVVNVVANAHYLFHGKLKGYANEFSKRGSILRGYEATVKAAMFIKDDSFYREENTSARMNMPILADYHGVSIYYNLSNSNFLNAMLEHENRDQEGYSGINGTDNRAILGTLMSVKYLVAKPDESAFVPFGYQLIHEDAEYRLYRNDYHLPLGYTYSKSISADVYKNLSVLDKQEALLQAVVLPGPGVGRETEALSFTNTRIPYKIANYKDVTWENGLLSVNKNTATLDLSFAGRPNSETYVRLVGFDSDTRSRTTVSFKGNRLTKDQGVYFWRNNFYFHKNDYLINMGYSPEAQAALTITFADKGEYKLDKIEIYCQPLAAYPARINKLKENVLEDVSLGINRLSGRIDLSEDKILVLSLPFSPGWSAKVDGVNQELKPANTMFMALPLTSGRHYIELQYFTPGLKLGLACTALGFIMLVFLVWLYRRCPPSREG